MTAQAMKQSRTYMKSSILLLAVAVVAPQLIQAQGTFLSNLGQSSAGSLAVASDSWFAAGFFTGTNAAGYMLDSIQLAMTDASGSPSGFTVSLYSPATGSVRPDRSLATLNGSLDPVSSGIYTYTPATNLTLAPNYAYSIVLTAGTPLANGAYGWSYAAINSYNPSDGWLCRGVWTSSNGSVPWTGSAGAFPLFAVNATAVPEPGVLSLFILGGFLVVSRRRKVPVG